MGSQLCAIVAPAPDAARRQDSETSLIDGTCGPPDRAGQAWPLLIEGPMRLSLLVFALAVWLPAGPAFAACTGVSSAAGLCTLVQSGTCFIDGKQCTVVPGAILDFGTQAVVLRQGSSLTATNGDMTVLAKSLELQQGTGLLGPGATIAVKTTGAISIVRPSQGSPARIDVSNYSSGGQIDLESTGGTIQIDGIVDARGLNTDGIGGSIDITGANVLVSGDVRTSGGNLGAGGSVSMDAKVGNVLLSGNLDGSGGSGGPVDLTAEGTVNASGNIDIRATAAGGDGGLLDVFSTSGSINLGGKISMQGDEGTDTDGGGNGGEMNVFSAGNLTLSAAFEISGAPPDGQGGDVFFMSMLDTIQTGTMLVQGRGAESDGGTVEFDVHKALTLGAIDVHGGESLPDSGGALVATSWCDLTVPSGVILNALGDRGSIHLQSGALLTAAGQLRAGGESVLGYLDTMPITAGGTFLPELTLEQIPTLTPCGGFVPVSCGDGTLDPGEECDDHNTVSCDGCSSLCLIEKCGNGRLDCGEACDDGNTTSGDTCHGDCSRADNVCGDLHVDSGETCDDGNTVACDGCSSTCQVESCGNGTVECAEECDTPNVGGCSADCMRLVPPGCGDGVLSGQEECDDGNTVDGDGCTHQCREERCGNGTVDPGEDCDDFNQTGCDGCSPSCKVEVCGNGVLDCGEECDQGAANGTPGSSCLACQPAPTCSSGGTSPCIPCGTNTDCDPLDRCGSAVCADGICTPQAPPSCNNANVCDGLETCDPAFGCRPGTPLSCDDHDACTTDGCDPIAGCSNDEFVGIDLPRCRLSGALDLLSAAGPSDVKAPIRTKLSKKLGVADGKLLAADQAGSNAKKAKKALKAAGRQLQAAIRLAMKQRGKGIKAATADALLAALQPIPGLVSAVTP
jgi:cysteine-rich repeat protein